MQVILISKPTVENLGPALKQITQEVYNNETLDDYLDTLSVLGNTNNLRDRSVLRHLGFSFLLVAADDTIRESLERTDLHHIVFDTIRRGFSGVILSGTVAQFKDAITECCDSNSTTDIRELYNEIYLALQSSGLRRIWTDTTTKKIVDGTFLIKVN